MWGNSRKRKAAKIDMLIGRRTEVSGDIKFGSGLHVDGIVKGNIIGEADGPSVLSLSEHGTIEGEIHVPHNMLNGAVIGNVYSSEHIELAPKSRITGDVYYNLLEMSAGAQVNGRLIHAPNTGEETPGPVDDTTDEG